MAIAHRSLERAILQAQDILPEERRDQMRAQISNTLALIAYHRHQDGEALRLEQAAEDIARASAEAEMNEWASVTLALNRAKLLEKRFGDSAAALQLLLGLVGNRDKGVRARARCDVARLLLNQHDWPDLVNLIDKALDGPNTAILRDDEELSLRVIRTTALLATGQKARARCECDRLLEANRFFGSDVVLNLVEHFQSLLQSQLSDR